MEYLYIFLVHTFVGDKEAKGSAKGFHPYIKYAYSHMLSRNFPRSIAPLMSLDHTAPVLYT